jgi:hypothetical protein
MIITAEDESSRVVATIPTIKLLKVLEVYLWILLEALSPRAFLIVSDRLLTAKRNRTKPAITDSIISVIIEIIFCKITINGCQLVKLALIF